MAMVMCEERVKVRSFFDGRIVGYGTLKMYDQDSGQAWVRLDKSKSDILVAIDDLDEEVYENSGAL